MYSRQSSSSSLGLTGVFLFGCYVALAVSIGAWCVQYVVGYWTLYFLHVAKHVPYLPAALAALFFDSLAIPAAVFTWLLSFIL